MKVRYNYENLRVDVRCCRKIIRITAIVLAARILVDTNVVHTHSGWERQVVEVDETEVLGHTEVDDEVLGNKGVGKTVRLNQRATHHGFLRDGTSADLNVGIGGHAWLQDRPSELIVVDPKNLLLYVSVKVVVSGK